jgi:Tol biopolymer transport system component
MTVMNSRCSKVIQLSAGLPNPVRIVLARASTALVLVMGVVAAGGPAHATFPGPNGLIAFDTGDGGASQIYSVRSDGTGLRQLTGQSGSGLAYLPKWSADGRLIVYVSDQTGNFEVYVMNADGSGQHQVTDDAAFGNFWPSFSRDGSSIIFSRCSNFLGTCDIAVMRSDGRHIRALVAGYWHHVQPIFSPDGMRISFNSDEGGFDGLVRTVNADGTGFQTVMQPRARFGFSIDNPNWSPDGDLLTFTGTQGGIFTIRSDGTNLRNLSPSSTSWGSYSPDGRKMVLRGSDGQLCTMNADGSGLALIPNLPPATGFPSWGTAQ